MLYDRRDMRNLLSSSRLQHRMQVEQSNEQANEHGTANVQPTNACIDALGAFYAALL